jgi:hypothetical protein
MSTLITPTTPATFYDFNDELVTVPLVTLAAWAAGYGRDINGIREIVRAFLSVPEGYEDEYVREHIQLCYKNTKEHYGIQ